MANRFDLYLIRHAQSANNAVPESERVEDPELTSIGLQQADLLADAFRGQTFTHLLTSGFLRAIQTMQPLASAVSQTPHIWTDLHEVGGCFKGFEYGKLEGCPGMNRETLSTTFPEFVLPDDIDDTGWWRSRPFEDDVQARRRAASQAERLQRAFRNTTSRVACVIHADFKALLLEALLGDDYRQYVTADLVNTGVTLLRYENDRVGVHDFNSAAHLPGELVTS